MSQNIFIVKASVVANRPLAPDTYLMTLSCPEVATRAAPGQFLKIRTWSQGPLLDRPFSIHHCCGDQLSLLYRVLGPATKLMSQAQAGAEAQISGPLGQGLNQIVGPETKMYLAAGGIGLAPMRLVGDWLTNPAPLFYGERSGQMQLAEDWLKSWSADPVSLTESGSGYGCRGLVTEPLREALEREARAVFACGPTPMLAAITDLCRDFGVQALVSTEASMACGLGVCLTCSLPLIGGRRFRVCQEGPVLDGSRVDWNRIRR